MLAEAAAVFIAYIVSPIDRVLDTIWGATAFIFESILKLCKYGLYLLLVLYILKYTGNIYAELILNKYLKFLLKISYIRAKRIYRIGAVDYFKFLLSRIIKLNQ